MSHPFAAHARLSPSAAESWMTCAGYPNAVAGLPNDSSEAAAEGTAAHTISELCFTTGFSAYDFLGHVTKVEGFTFVWDDDDAELLQPGIDEMLAFGGQFYGEHRVDLSAWLGDGQFGTLDRAVILPDLIVIGDLKWGRGTPVSPIANKQLMLYALGFWWNVARHVSEATEFLIIIDQPRCAGGGGKWRVTLEELLAFGETVRERAAATLDPQAPRTASAKGCLFCRRRQQPPSEPGAVTGCLTFDRYNLELLSLEFEDLDGPGALELPTQLSADRRARIWEHQGMIEKWLEQIAASLLAETHAAGELAGLKVVAGRKSPDKWTDAAAAEAFLKATLSHDRIFTKKLITPTQAGKVVPSEQRDALAAHVKTGERKPTLVPVADDRPGLTLADKFDDLPEQP